MKKKAEKKRGCLLFEDSLFILGLNVGRNDCERGNFSDEGPVVVRRLQTIRVVKERRNEKQQE